MVHPKLALRVSLFCLTLAAGLHAQGVDATLKGRVTDSSAGAVPGVKVEAKNTGTNVVSSTVTDSAGQYAVPFLKPGSYSVTVEAPGFKKFLREGLSLSVGDTVEVDIALHHRGRRSEPFPWAAVSADRVCRLAGRSGLAVAERWSQARRWFVRLVVA